MQSRHLRHEVIGLAIAAAIALIAVPAGAQDRCEGTLCDLYYGNSPKPPPSTATQPAAPTPLMAPNRTIFGSLFGGSSGQQSQQPADGSAPPRKPMVAVQGSGLLGMMHGDPQERCSGTLCDFYYGGPAPEKPEPSAERATTGTAPAADETLAPQTEYPSRVVDQPVERHCADTRDPWSCYRR